MSGVPKGESIEKSGISVQEKETLSGGQNRHVAGGSLPVVWTVPSDPGEGRLKAKGSRAGRGPQPTHSDFCAEC